VVRDGKRVSVDADQVMPGDVVFIKSGDKVPADLRLLQVTNLQVGSDSRRLTNAELYFGYHGTCSVLLLAGCCHAAATAA
jgi:hypothetical protein